MDPLPVDRDVVEELMAGTGAEFVRELVGTFVTEAAAMIGTLRRSLSDGDAEAFRRTAHSLKSNALTFGAGGLAERAKALEHGGLAHARRADGAIDELEGEYRRVVLALKEIVGE